MHLDGSSNVLAILCMFLSGSHSVYIVVVSSSSYKVTTDGVCGYIYRRKVVRTVSPSGVGHPYNMCRHLVVLGYLVRVRETSGGLDR